MVAQEQAQIQIPLTIEKLEKLLNVLRSKLGSKYYAIENPDSIDIYYVTLEDSSLKTLCYDVMFDISEDNQLKIINLEEIPEDVCPYYIIDNIIFADNVENVNIPEVLDVSSRFYSRVEIRYTDYVSYDIVTLLVKYDEYSLLIIVFAKGY